MMEAAQLNSWILKCKVSNIQWQPMGRGLMVALASPLLAKDVCTLLCIIEVTGGHRASSLGQTS